MTKIVIIGDAYVSSETLKSSVKLMNLPQPLEIEIFQWFSDTSKTDFQNRITEIEKQGPEIFSPDELLLESLKHADYLFVHFAPITVKMIEVAKKLKLIGTCRGGLEHIAIEEAAKKNIPVLHVIRNAGPVADFTIGLMYAATRNIALSHEAIKQGTWRKNFPNVPYRTTLNRQTVALIGFGHVGKLVARKLTALKVSVLVYDPFLTQKQLDKLGLKLKLVDLKTAFQTADIVSLHLRLTPETTNIIDKHLLNLMKPSAYLINTARAGVLNQADFISLLKKQQIAGAAIDVVWQEPLKNDNPLLKLDNLTLTSHIAGDTVDAIPNSPYLLKDAVNDYLKQGVTDLLS